MQSMMAARIMHGWLAMLLVTGLALAVASATAGEAPSPAALTAASLPALVARLPAADFSDKQQIVRQVAAIGDPAARRVLQALLDGSLGSRGDGSVVVSAAQGAGWVDPLTGAAPAGGSDEEPVHIPVNNQLRKLLRALLAQTDLASAQVGRRLAAVDEMLRAPDAEMISILRARLPVEPDARVRTAIAAGLALADLDSPEASHRLAAVGELRSSLSPDVLARLQSLAGAGEDATGSDPDSRVRVAATTAAHSIAAWRRWYGAIETLLFGLSLGSILVLAAIGLAITFGVMGVINMAHGEMMMLGAYTTFVVQQLMPEHTGASLFVALPAAFLVAGAVGVLIERLVVRHLYGRPLETLLATFGISLVLQQVVRDLFTANNRPVVTPAWMSGSLQLNEALSITYNRLYIILFTALVFAGLQLVLRRTQLGLAMRAVAQNRGMARAMGVRTEWVDALTFGLGSGIAGLAGVALSQVTNVGPNLGQSYIVDSFMVVVFGGVGNLWGTQLSGLSLGVLNKLLEPFSGAVLAKIVVLVFLILFIQRRPRGLFPQKGRAAEG
jgi:urea transport system permease protein